MPVTPEEWESGVAYTPLAKGLLSFLRENAPMGFSAVELYNMLSDIGNEHEFNTQSLRQYNVQEALDGLVTNEQLESKELEDETSSDIYYRATN